ncbi:hypothetical protein [Hirschia baltica]|uniref:Lipoprotein n=1 Tax=Hirschia baltica (strain ATCC 49814 / DSM 5838 / IFAM 1418) TaxID=582402 RepID=C6XQV2_HIRBI|nr:hypothetical protein [Hirschia baltica]ACT58708.1 hypothetical protein Hbal_1014 [Hirschia baltica ATCC 49814]
MRSFLLAFLSTICLTSLIACGTEAKQSERVMFQDKPEKVRAVGLRSNLDPFTVAIGAERWNVIIGKARSALELKHSTPSEDDLVRIDLALRAGVRDLLELRDALCLANEKPIETCVAIEIPEWAATPPNTVTSLIEYEARSQWLGEAANNLSAIGCEAGREVSNDEYLCAVE